jgi:hypothetical protein
MADGNLDETTTKNLRDGSLTIQDDSGTNSITVPFVDGDFSWSRKQNVIAVFDRGTFSHFRQGDDELMTWSFTCKYNQLYAQNLDDEAAYEALWQEENASGWTSVTSGDANETDVYCVDLVLTVTNAKDDATETMTISEAVIQSCDFAEGDEYNTLTMSGIAGCTAPTVGGSAAS